MESVKCFSENCDQKTEFGCRNCGKVMCLTHISKHLTDQSRKHNIEILLDQPEEPVKNYLTEFLVDYLQTLNEKENWVNSQALSIIESINKELSSVKAHLNFLRIQALKIIQRLKVPESSSILDEQTEEILKKSLEEVKKITSYWKPPSIHSFCDKVKMFSFDKRDLNDFTRIGMFYDQIIQDLDSLKTLNDLKNYSLQDNLKSNHQVLLEILKNSNNGKTSPKTAGKALTILSELNFDFTDQDLSSVQVSEAKINGGIFKNTLLSKSILKSSSFSKSLEIPQLSQDRLSEKSKIYKSFKGDSEVTSLVISPDQSKIIAGTESGSINIWELSSGLLLYSDLLHSQKVTCLDVSSDSVDLVSGSSDFSVKLFDLHQKKCILTLNSHLMPVTSVKISPDNEFIISAGSDNKIKISTKHGEPYSEYKSSSKVTCLSLPIMHDKDSESLLYGNTGGDVIFWKFGDKRPFWTAEKIHPGGVVSVILNKTAGKIITVGFDGIVKIWISFKGKKISRFFNPRSASVNIEASLGQNGFFDAQGVIGAKFCVGFDRELNVLVWNGRSAKVVGSHRVGFKTECFKSTQNLSHLAFVKGKNVRIFEVCRILKFSMD